MEYDDIEYKGKKIFKGLAETNKYYIDNKPAAYVLLFENTYPKLWFVIE